MFQIRFLWLKIHVCAEVYVTLEKNSNETRVSVLHLLYNKYII